MNQPSPIFTAVMTPPTAEIIRVCFGPQSLGCADPSDSSVKQQNRQLGITRKPIALANCQSVACVEEAEDHVINAAKLEFELTEDGHPLNLIAVRASNNIARRTLRAMGNVMFIHPDKVELMSQYEHLWFSGGDGDVGRWQHVGALSGNIEVYASEDMPLDRAVIAYVGSPVDAPGVLIDDNGSLLVHLLRAEPDVMGDLTDYVIGIKLP